MIRRRTLLLILGLLLPATARAQELADYDYENLSFSGFAVDYGYLWPNTVEATPVYTLRTDLSFLGPGVRIVPSLSYWSSRLRQSELERVADQLNRLEPLRQRDVNIGAQELGRIEWQDISLNVDAQVVWETLLGVRTYLGAGAGIHALNGRGPAIDDTFVENLLDTVTAGVSATAGFEFDAWRRLRLFGEGRYTLLSDVRYPGVSLGGAFILR